MNTEDDEFERIEREQAMRGVPDAIHHTDPNESLEYITGWNDCRQAMLEQPAQRTWVGLTDEEVENLCLSLGAEPIEVRFIEAKLKEKNT